MIKSPHRLLKSLSALSSLSLPLPPLATRFFFFFFSLALSYSSLPIALHVFGSSGFTDNFPD